MSNIWEQVIAAVVAAVIPLIVKILNDYHGKLTRNGDEVDSGNVD